MLLEPGAPFTAFSVETTVEFTGKQNFQGQVLHTDLEWIGGGGRPADSAAMAQNHPALLLAA